MSLHVVLLYPHGAQERGSTGSVYGLCCCRAVSAAVRPLCAVGLSGSCQAVTLGPDSDGAPLMSDSAVRLSDTCCQTVRESAVSAVRLSGTVRRCPGFAVRLSDQGSGTEKTHTVSSSRSRGTQGERVCVCLFVAAVTHSRDDLKLAGAVAEGATPRTDGRPSENTPVCGPRHTNP